MKTDKNIVRFPAMETIEMEAAHWVMRLDSDTLTPDEQGLFRSWIKRSVRHAEAFEAMAAMWGMADLLDAYNRTEPLAGADATRIPRRSALVGGAIAAGLVLILAGVATYMTPRTQEENVRTAVGEQRTLALADGSVVILNTNSEVQVEIGRDARVVRLMSGEAHFTVAKETSRAFHVHAGQNRVQAIGTAFTVRLRESEVEVTVTEGVVELFSKERRMPEDHAPADPEPVWRSLAALTVSETAVIDEAVERREKIDGARLERKLMWRDGFLAFAGEPLSDVVSEMSRYTQVEIQIADQALASLPIAGAFEAGNTTAMLESLEAAFGIRAMPTGSNRLVLVRSE